MALTPKQEAFAMAYIETGNASEAYRQAYDAENMKAESIWVAACRVLGDTNVGLRVAELQEEARKRHSVTVLSLTAELDEARALALADPKGAAAAVSATMGKAKLHGLLIDKGEMTGANGGPIQIEAAQDAERFTGAILGLAARSGETSET